MTHLLAAEGGYQAFVLTGTEKVWLVVAFAAAVFGIVWGCSSMRGVLAADQGTLDARDRRCHPGGRRGLPERVSSGPSA